MIVFYAVFGGLEDHVTLRFGDDITEAIRRNIIERYRFLKEKIITPSMHETHSRRMLQAVAQSDGKRINVWRRAALSRNRGHATYDKLRNIGVLQQENSRESEPKIPKKRRKKEERSYIVQDKIRFVHPFHRFWYTFVEPCAREIEKGDFEYFFKKIETELDRFVSLTFEELANALIQKEFSRKDPIEEKGSYWDRHNEFDLLAKTRSRRTIVGECKWKSHKICKSELSKIRAKCKKSGIEADYVALFSRSGFSKELQNNKDPSLLRFDIGDFERLLG